MCPNFVLHQVEKFAVSWGSLLPRGHREEGMEDLLALGSQYSLVLEQYSKEGDK